MNLTEQITQAEIQRDRFNANQRGYFSSRYYDNCYAIAAWLREIQNRLNDYPRLPTTPKRRANAMRISHCTIMKKWWLIVKHQRENSEMERENFDVVREAILSEYKIVPLDPARPTRRQSVVISTTPWVPVRDDHAKRRHAAYRWENGPTTTRVLSTVEGCAA